MTLVSHLSRNHQSNVRAREKGLKPGRRKGPWVLLGGRFYELSPPRVLWQGRVAGVIFEEGEVSIHPLFYVVSI